MWQSVFSSQKSVVRMNEELKELRLKVARMEGAAKRLLDALGCSVDGRKGPDATLDAIREAAEAAVKKSKWEF